jgi:hypothetical protein
VHLRRALLLFAIVLGLAAIVTSLSSPRRNGDGSPQPPPQSSPQPAPRVTPGPPPAPFERIAFTAGGRHERRKLRVGTHALVTVAVDRPGQVELEGFGLTQAADPDTPASFDVLRDSPLRARVVFMPADADRALPVGTLVIVG